LLHAVGFRPLMVNKSCIVCG